ncbi:MFS general substrate transporter [Lentithecium fluviatile CBS 122367]|uniref:MFS general substrate transporter n=1 Tax=Lentithecium fluviatile CBS 122367 TaxID=1168545 RepID=A0A6G1IUH1_9PLEO|nr:MFS general substrate transporter [Lentithecium fluviatile CBS 122367]
MTNDIAHESPPSQSKERISNEIGGTENTNEEATKFLKGWPLLILSSTLGLAIFLVTIEVTIVATSLNPITDDLHAFDKTSWIITAYLVTYTSFHIISAKLSDIFGRKAAVITSLCLFTLSSGACGASRNVTQLIILRAFQGIGASGSYSVIVAIFFELVPPAQFARTTSLISSIFALAFLLGPLLGGVITQFSTWRWVFLLNVPAGSICVLGLAVTLPNHFPDQKRVTSQPMKWTQPFSKSQLSRLDLFGTTLLLSASVLLVTALEQAGNPNPWGSLLIITCLLLSVLSWLCFFAWSKVSTKDGVARELVFPWRLIQTRFSVGLLITIFLTGMPLTVAIIEIPLRFQAVNSLSPLQAGIRLLPYAVLNPLGSIIAPYAAKRFRVPPIYMMLTGAVIQVVGTALLSTASTSMVGIVPAETHVYEGLAGFGTGVNLA